MVRHCNSPPSYSAPPGPCGQQATPSHYGATQAIDRVDAKAKKAIKLGLVSLFFFLAFVYFACSALLGSTVQVGDEIPMYRNNTGMYWDIPKPLPHCSIYGGREYMARLRDIPAFYDWKTACLNTPVNIHGQNYEKPDYCQSKGLFGVYGYWLVHNEMICKPYWGSFTDTGCMISGEKRIIAQLYNLRKGDDWIEMCASAPTKIGNTAYAHPSYCENRGRQGMIGIWDIVDPSCQ